MPVSALLFDIGNVLVTFDFAIAARRFAQQCPFSEDQIIQLIEPLKVPLECGRLGDDEFVSRGMELIRFAGSPAEFAEIWCGIFAVNRPMEPLLARLPASRPRHLLSNTSGLHKDHLFAGFRIFRHFQGGVFSHLAGCMKPEERIFRIAIDELGLVPEETLYIDDLPQNIEAAAGIGFHTHHYSPDDHASLEARLGDEGLLGRD